MAGCRSCLGKDLLGARSNDATDCPGIGGGGEAYSFSVFLRHLTIGRASLSRRGRPEGLYSDPRIMGFTRVVDFYPPLGWRQPMRLVMSTSAGFDAGIAFFVGGGGARVFIMFPES